MTWTGIGIGVQSGAILYPAAFMIVREAAFIAFRSMRAASGMES
jgi:hypothetical protein